MGPTRLTNGPWWNDPTARERFEGGAATVAQWMLGRRTGDGFEYVLFLPVEDLGAPQIRVRFSAGNPHGAKVYSPPLGRTPHRYPDGRMCLWYPLHPRDRRWEFDDGLRELLLMAGAHLAREDLWRRFGEWPGPEMPHGYPKDEDE